MRPIRLVRMLFMVSLLGVTFSVYLITMRLGLNFFYPLHSTGRILKARFNDVVSRLMPYGPTYTPCVSNSKHNLTPYLLDSPRLEQVARSLRLNLKDAWVSSAPSLFSKEEFQKVDIPQFKARVPALVYFKKTFLAFCEARFDGVKDWGNMMLSLRRGRLRGRKVTWERIRLIAGIPDHRIMNPSPVVDHQNGVIVVVFSAFPTHMNFVELLEHAGESMSRVYVMKSYDVGLTWTDPLEITDRTIGLINPFPVSYVPGPGHSIQMKCGRLVVPGNFFTLQQSGKGIRGMCSNCTNLSNIIYSDDGGTTWHLGAMTTPAKDASGAPIHPNEAQLADLDNGTLYMTVRTLDSIQPRAQYYSYDGGQTLSNVRLHATLVEPGFKKRNGVWKPIIAGGCQGSVISANIDGRTSTPQKTWLVLSNPADPLDRVNLGIRLSVDGGQTWSEPWIIFPYKAAYSDLAYFETVTNGRTERYFAVLFEGGSFHSSDHMKFQMFNLEALIKNILNHEKQNES